MKENLAIIPARGGSKGLPGKNIKRLNGLPLIAYTIKAALGSRKISRVVVTTDERTIADTALRYGAEVIMRPASLARDDSLMADVVFHCLDRLRKEEGYVPENFILLQPTSPLRTARHIDEAFALLGSGGCDSVISVFKPPFHPLKSFRVSERGYLRGIVSDKYCFTPRQLLPESVAANGAIFLIKTKEFLKRRALLTSRTRPYYMGELESADIDNISDFKYVAYLTGRRRGI